ncbi:hypothetical protein [Nitrospirillum amazonense]|uniref:hypothetical protein n=1 Tax=Nitrospirillum amazonense TaxID=28077 RepID=UPI0011A88DE4|nr:hypothetical protein [Nitrospirillum amazonense]
MPTLPLDRAAVTLAGLGVIAGVAMALVGIFAVPNPAAVTVPALPRALLPPLPPTAVPAAEVGEAVRRPLFSESRRPPPPKPIAPPPPVLVPAPELQVTGIIAGVGGGVVLGTDKHTQKPFRLKTGEMLGDWRVDGITRTSLRLRHADQVQDYPLATPPTITPAPRPR